MTTTPQGFARKLDQIADDISGRAMRAALTKVGAEGKQNINAAVRGTLGDQSMSNWRRGRPIQISGRYEVRSDTALELLPARRAGGPMRVLEDGRKAGTARSGRPVSATRGKGTWSKAEQTMERTLPRIAAEAVRDSLRRQFGG